jgi:tetratricopeptide (TPR) repeat protein
MFRFTKSKENQLKEALKIIDKGDIKAGISILTKLAKAEYNEAEYCLGYAAEFKLENYEEAVKWYRIAAAHGYAQAQWCLGNLYLKGFGVEQNIIEAVKWYKAAAENNVPEAQFTLGEFYRSGLHVTKNPEIALNWYQKSAEAGFEAADTRIQQFWPNGIYSENESGKQVCD